MDSVASLGSRATACQNVNTVGSDEQYRGEIVGCEIRMVPRVTTKVMVVMGTDPLNLAMNVIVPEVL